MRQLLFSVIEYLYLKLLFIIWFYCLHIQLNAQTYGCHVQRDMQEILYYTPYGAGSPSEWQTVVSGPITSSGEKGGYREDGTASYGCIKDIGDLCTVYQQYESDAGPPQVISMRAYKTGIYASIAPENCPIDDYIPFALVGAAGIGVFILRKREFRVIG